MKDLKIKYIKDAMGNEEAVMIPIQEWRKIEAQLNEILHYSALKSGLKDAFTELNDLIKGKIKPENAKDFLNEC